MKDIESLQGDFTKNLFSLQLQIKSLLDGAGGEDAGAFLDRISDLNESERGIVLKIFQRALDRLANSGVEVKTLRDEQLRQFEDALYDNLVDGMTALKREHTSKPLSVVDGGKLPTRKKASKTVCLTEARRKRRQLDGTPPTWN